MEKAKPSRPLLNRRPAEAEAALTVVSELQTVLSGYKQRLQEISGQKAEDTSNKYSAKKVQFSDPIEEAYRQNKAWYDNRNISNSPLSNGPAYPIKKTEKGKSSPDKTGYTQRQQEIKNKFLPPKSTQRKGCVNSKSSSTTPIPAAAVSRSSSAFSPNNTKTTNSSFNAKPSINYPILSSDEECNEPDNNTRAKRTSRGFFSFFRRRKNSRRRDCNSPLPERPVARRNDFSKVLYCVPKQPGLMFGDTKLPERPLYDVPKKLDRSNAGFFEEEPEFLYSGRDVKFLRAEKDLPTTGVDASSSLYNL